MDKVKPRYNAGLQRTKGILEIAAALSDTSLSTLGTRGGTTTPQINSRLGSRLSLRLEPQSAAPVGNTVGLSFGVGGSRGNLMQVARKELSLLWINPNAPLALAYQGRPPFPEPLPLRAIAVFPSWDAVVIAVHESTGITSIEQIREQRYPLRVSTGATIAPPFEEDPTMFTVTSILAAAGIALDDIRSWGGSVASVRYPSHRDRSDAISNGTIDAIFDEGCLSWGQFAVERGFRILPIEGDLRGGATADRKQHHHCAFHWTSTPFDKLK